MKKLGIFYHSQYSKDNSNQRPDNQGPAVFEILAANMLFPMNIGPSIMLLM